MVKLDKKLTMNKNFLRQKFKKLRSSISEEEKLKSEKFILKKLKNHLQEKQIIAIYYPLKSEVNLISLKEYYPNILLPKIINNSSLKFFSIQEKLINNPVFKIKEPIGHKEVKPDIIICPLIAFDKHKNRLGYGKGYYDKFLNNNNVTKIATAFSVQEAEQIPYENHDIKMDLIITEKDIF